MWQENRVPACQAHPQIGDPWDRANRLLPTLPLFSSDNFSHNSTDASRGINTHPARLFKASCLGTTLPATYKKTSNDKERGQLSCVPDELRSPTPHESDPDPLKHLQISNSRCASRVFRIRPPCSAPGSRVSYYYADRLIHNVCPCTAAAKKIRLWTIVGA